jgi:hypothetical protein
MIRLLAVEADDDTPTRAAYAYRKEHVYAPIPPGDAAVLWGPLAQRKLFANRATALSPRYVVGVGHGDDDSLMGYAGETILEPGLYEPAEVKDRIVHLVACETAVTLSVDLVRKGAVAFLGYNWLVLVHPEILEDFLECDTEIDLALLAGDRVRDAYDRSLALFDLHIARLKADGCALKAALMETNRDSLVCPVNDRRLGDPEARL